MFANLGTRGRLRSGCLRQGDESTKSPSRAKLAPLVGLAPTDTGLKGQPHDGLAFRGIKWLLGLDSHQDLFA